jgi:hypothetical protein
MIVDSIGLGLALWLAGYLSSLILYFVLPKDVLGWVLFVVFLPVTLYVAYWRFHGRELSTGYLLSVAASWTLIAVVFDYVFIVMMLNAQGYYAADVFLYYAVTFLIPLAIGSKYRKVGAK